MADTQYLALITYDVSNNRDRRRVAEHLEQAMVRVQDSVFEGWMSARAAQTLADGAARHVQQGDSLRLYLVPPSAIDRCTAWGFPPAPESGGHLIL